MVKLNEALIIGGSLLVALVLSKGGDFIKNFSMPQNSAVSVISPIAESVVLPKVQVYQQEKPITFSGNQILSNVLDQEKEILDTKIQTVQQEIDKAYDYINTQKVYTQPIKYDKYFSARTGNLAILYQDESKKIKNIFGEISTSTIKQFIENYPSSRGLKNYYNQAIELENISKTESFIETGQTEISNLLSDYDTKFGGLSRYG